MATQKDKQPSGKASSPFPPSFASCGVHILSSTVDQELLAHLQSHSTTADSFYHLVEIFKHLQEHPLLSDYLHDAKGGSSKGDDKDDGQKQASTSSPSSSMASTTTTTTTDAATSLKQFQSCLSLKDFILRSFVKSILLLYLQQKRLAAQQQSQAVGGGSTSIKEPHAAAFASLCCFLGTELMPTLDDIHVVGEEEDDSDDDDEEDDDEEEEDWWSSLSASCRKDNNDGKNKSNKFMGNVMEEVDEEAGPVAKEGDGDGKEGGRNKGNTVAPTTVDVKKKKGYSMPQSLSYVWILSQALEQHLILELWQDETRSTRTRAMQIYQVASLFRNLQEDGNILRLLVSRSSTTRNASNHLPEQQHQEISTIPQLREFILHSSVKAKLLEHVQNIINVRGITLVLFYLGLKVTAAYDDVVPISVGEALKKQRPRGSLSMSHAPSLSAEVQKFIVDLFINDNSRDKNTNMKYLSQFLTSWGLLEKQLVENITFSSSSGFPLTPPLATPEDLRSALMENADLKTCFLSLRNTMSGIAKAAQMSFLGTLGLGISRGGDGMRNIVEKMEKDTKRKKGRPLKKKPVADNEENQGPIGSDHASSAIAVGAAAAATAATHTTASQSALSDEGEEEAQAKRRRVVEQGIHALPLPLQYLVRILVDHRESVDFLPMQQGLIQEGLRRIHEQDKHVLRFVSELLEGDPPLVDLRNPHMRRELALSYLKLIQDGAFDDLAAGEGLKEG